MRGPIATYRLTIRPRSESVMEVVGVDGTFERVAGLDNGAARRLLHEVQSQYRPSRKRLRTATDDASSRLSARPVVDHQVISRGDSSGLFVTDGNGPGSHIATDSSREAVNLATWVLVSHGHDVFQPFDQELVVVPTGEVPPVDIVAWLADHSAVSSAVGWVDDDGDQAWAAWPTAWREDFVDRFDKHWLGATVEAAETPENYAAPEADGKDAETGLFPNDAWDIFISSVALSLVRSIRNTTSAWPLTSLAPSDLRRLLHSDNFFDHSHSNKYDTVFYAIRRSHGHATPTSPSLILKFLHENDIETSGAIPSLHRLIEWCRDNLRHHAGSPSLNSPGRTYKGMEMVWQYRGRAPVSRTIEGTYNHKLDPPEFAHWTDGCWGTVGFLKSILRVMNLPTEIFRNSSHAMLRVAGPDLHLSHGDDPYGPAVKSGNFSGAEILVDSATFHLWFGSDTPASKVSSNRGRQPRELAIEHLPPYLLGLYCSDIAQQRNHEHGTVATYLRDYTVDELETMDLWTRMDTRLSEIGGCDQVN